MILSTYPTLCANMEHLLKTLIVYTCITDVAEGNTRSPYILKYPLQFSPFF